MKKLLFLITAILAGAQPFAQSDPKQAALAWIDGNASTLSRVNRNIWGWAETGLEEVKSSKELQDLLSANGFTVQTGVAGMPTAFVATYGSGRPVIGILAEYDALPGLSQDASPERATRAGVMAGHGCGHSVFGVGSTAAAIGVKQAMASGAIKGTVKLFGTPAEETGIGKTYMLREGLFKDVDTILSWHAGDATAASWDYSKAMISVKFRFEGLPAHASTSPHQGKSALDAVELMNVGVNYMREHVKEDTRIHYVITNGGGQPNVVPPSAEVWYYLRANKHTDVEEYYVWMQEIARGAAQMSAHQAGRDARRLRHARSAAEPHARRGDPEEPRAGRPAEVRRSRKGVRARHAEGSEAAAGDRVVGARRAAAAGTAVPGTALDGRRRSHVVLPGGSAHRRDATPTARRATAGRSSPARARASARRA